MKEKQVRLPLRFGAVASSLVFGLTGCSGKLPAIFQTSRLDDRYWSNEVNYYRPCPNGSEYVSGARGGYTRCKGDDITKHTQEAVFSW